MNTTAGGSREDMLSYQELRKTIGIIGIALPVVLVVFGWIFYEGPLQPTISDYYYTSMRGVLVGSLCVIGIFLYSYRGYKDSPVDNIAGNLACLFAVGVALCPTTPEWEPSLCEAILGRAHIACAVLFFGTLAFFCFFLFTKTHPEVRLTRQKLCRNNTYLVCGATIAACIASIVAYAVAFPESAVKDLEWMRPIFWYESLAIWAFGFSWFVKGGAILADKN